MRSILRTASVLAFLIAAGFVIQTAMTVFGVSPAAFAKPSEILATLPQFGPGGRFAGDVWQTTLRGFESFLLALPIGFAFGLMVVRARIFRSPLGFVMDFLRSTPATALVPLFLIIFGPGTSSKIAAGAFTGALSIALSVVIGIQNLDRDRKVVANLIGLRGFRRAFLYELPEALPAIFVGIRSAVSLALILVIVAEMLIGSNTGLGHVIMDMRYTDDVPAVYAAIFCAGALGYVGNMIVSLMEMVFTQRLALDVQ